MVSELKDDCQEIRNASNSLSGAGGDTKPQTGATRMAETSTGYERPRSLEDHSSYT